YRGRVSTPDALTLVAQFDYAGTVIEDYGGQVNPTPQCAPELNVVVDCPAPYVPAEFQPGIQRTVSAAIQLNQSGSLLSQVRLGERGLYNGTPLVLVADTALVGSGGSCVPNVCPPLEDNGVPFAFVDENVRNNFRYFYAVTAFDLNSWQSGPTNLESARITKSITPTKPATNFDNSSTVTQGIYGRDVLLDHTSAAPTLDAATGKFSGPFPASNAWTIGLASLVSEVLSGSGGATVRLDSLRLGAPYNSPAVAHEYWYTGSSGGGSVKLMIPITQPSEIGLRTGSAQLPAVFIDGSLAMRYGGDGSYSIPAMMGISMEGPVYHSLYGRGCVNGWDGFDNTGTFRQCAYNGSRWFDGPSPAMNEVMDHPIGANVANFSGNSMSANYSNAGQLTGVSLIHNTQAYQSVGGGEFRPMEGIKSGARRAADFNVYWGTGGTIDSVIDITHNVAVPFAADHLGGTWGILNPSESATDPAGSYDGRPELTNTDFHCVPPVNDVSTNDPGGAGCQGAVFTLSQTAVPGPIVPFSTGLAAAATDPVFADAGFGLYLSGDIFTIGLAGGTLPSDGTVWSLRTYIGAISGGVGAGGDYGPATFNVFPFGTVVPRSWTAVGTEIRVSFDVVNKVNQPTADDIANVHPVPDPYYITNEFETSSTDNRIEFINLPAQAIIRIYSSSGVLVDLLEHNSTQAGGSETWNVRNRNNQAVASGVYFFHVEANDQRKVGRMTIIRFAE
ncbi:MAG: T9SS type A sorting domain-containing protein, partial [Gemmatimonadales bacterium]